jgi:hypothetical protein
MLCSVHGSVGLRPPWRPFRLTFFEPSIKAGYVCLAGAILANDKQVV